MTTGLRVTAAEKIKICDLYAGGASISALVSDLHRSSETIWRTLHKEGILRSRSVARALVVKNGTAKAPPNNRKHFFNEDFFAVLTPVSAWILGIIFGDGSVNKKGRLLIAFGPDKDLAEKVADHLHYIGPLLFKRNCWMLEITSQRLVTDLNRYGVIPAKTYTMAFPILPEELLAPFVRGLLESDGTVRRRRTRCLTLRFSTASGDFIKTLRQTLVLQTGLSGILYEPKGKDRRGRVNRTWDLVYSKTAEAQRLALWLYSDATTTVRSDRKFSVLGLIQ